MDFDLLRTPRLAGGPPTAHPRRHPRFASLGALGLTFSLALAACSGSGGSQAPGASTSGGGGAAASSDTGAGASGGTGAGASGGTGAGASGGTAFQPPATKVSLRLWNGLTGPDGEAFNKIVDDFNKETPNVQVTVETQPGAEFQQRLEAAASANQVPQIIVMGYDMIAQNAVTQIIQPIDDFVQQSGLSGDDFSAETWNAGQWQGKRYGVPVDAHTLSFFWNKKIFRAAGLDPEKPPTDKASFEAAIQAINSKTGTPGYMVVGSGASANFLQGLVFATLFYQGGGQWTNQDFSQATYNSQAGIQAADYLSHLVKDLKAPVVEGDSEINAFKQGKNGMLFAGIWETSANSKALGDDLGVGVIPKIFGPGVWAGSHNATVAAGVEGDQKAGAYYFIDWFNKHSLEFANGGQIPAAKSVRDQLSSSSEGLLPLIAKIAPQFPDAKFLPAIPGGGDLLFLENGAAEAAVKVINGKQDSKGALDASASYFTQVLQENKQKYGY